MVIKIFCVIIIATLSSCSIGVEKKAKNNLYSAYSEYVTNLNNKPKFDNAELKKLFSYLSPRYQEYLLGGRERSSEVLADIINKSLDLPGYYAVEIAHYELYNNDTSCPLINAKKSDNSKIAIYVKYVKSQNWLIDNVIIEFINKDDNYLKTPICDSLKLQKKRMENWGN